MDGGLAAIESAAVTPHIRCLTVPSVALPPGVGTNVYLIGGDDEAIMVDAGYADATALAAAQAGLARRGPRRVSLLVLTHHHADHVQQAGAMAARLGCPLAAHPQAAARLADLGPIRPLHEGDGLSAGGVAVTVLTAPGHTDGHLHLHVPADRAMLVGDNLAGEGTVSILPPEGNLTDYLASLRRILTYDLDLLAPGHGPMLRDPRAAVQTVVEHRLMREVQILALLRSAPLSLMELTRAIYEGQIRPELMLPAQRTTLAHLEKLEREGRVRAADGVYSLLQP